MTAAERKGWLMVGVLFLGMFFVYGGAFGTSGVFFIPLLKYLNVDRERLSLLGTVVAVGSGLLIPLVGWMLDRLDVRWVVGTGALVAGLSLLLASRAESFGFLLGAMALMAVGFAGVTVAPVAVVCSNWFKERRGLALGVVWSAFALGGSTMIQVCNYTIAHHGWRAGYVLLSLPILVLVAPLAFLLLRTRPQAAAAPGTLARGAKPLTGLEVRAGVRGRSFWLVGVIGFCYFVPANSLVIHLVPHLIALGLTPARAAGVLSVMWVVTAISKPIMGTFADRVGVRPAISILLGLMAVGLVILQRANSAPAITAFILTYGLGVGAPVALIPMLAAESYGLKRYGTLWGLNGIFITVAYVVGPLMLGASFDRYGSYGPALTVCAVMQAVAALMPLLCVRFLEASAMAEPHRAAAPAPAV